MTTRSFADTISSSPLYLFGAFSVAICVLTASSYISMPMYPVPVTMQTLAILMVGALAGPRLGAAMVLSWLGLAMMGAPVLAGGKAGALVFAGPTAGYLASFPLAAFLAGYVIRSKHSAIHFAGFLAIHAVILGMGWAWLSGLVGPQAALATGVTPFLIGALIKSALGASLLVVLPKRA